jgi:hypothetical protein
MEKLKPFEIHYVRRKCRLLEITANAFKIILLLNGKEAWIPKSLSTLEETDNGYSITIASWFYQQKFL